MPIFPLQGIVAAFIFLSDRSGQQFQNKVAQAGLMGTYDSFCDSAGMLSLFL